MRISEHLEHHAKRARRHVQERPKLQLLISVFASIFILTLLYYGAERYMVAHQDLNDPLSCAKLAFSGNMQRCENAVLANYSARMPEDRAVICTRKESFSSVSIICAEYDETVSTSIYRDALNERGISVWEPTTNISNHFRYRSLSAISTMQLVCDQAIVPTVIENNTINTAKPVNGSCVLIATTAEGSITSLPFNIS
jgi:hypothetical protein